MLSFPLCVGSEDPPPPPLPISDDPGNVTISSGSNEYHIVTFWSFAVTGTIISVLGILGNILAIVVLIQPRMRSSTAVYLVAQAVFDILVLVSMFLFMSLPNIIPVYQYVYFPLIQPYVYPFALISQTCSIYTTVAFTAERYVAVCYPLRSARWCTVNKARRALGLIVLGAVILNVPRMLEYRSCYSLYYRSNGALARRVAYEKTGFGASVEYHVTYRIVVHVLAMLVVPFCSLAFMNSMLIRAVRRSHHSQGRVINAKQHKENNLTIMLISVIAVFLICQLPSIPDNILSETTNMTLPLYKLYCMATLMVITNSAANFYLYCVFGHKFRRVFCHLCCWRFKCCHAFGGGFGADDTSVMLRGSSVGRNCNDGRMNGDPSSDKKSGSVSPRATYRYAKAPMGMRVSLGSNNPRNNEKAPAPNCQYTSIHNDNNKAASETNV